MNKKKIMTIVIGNYTFTFYIEEKVKQEKFGRLWDLLDSIIIIDKNMDNLIEKLNKDKDKFIKLINVLSINDSDEIITIDEIELYNDKLGDYLLVISQ